MKYGIDLGTTNSAICKMEDGKPSVLRTHMLRETLPSCVSFTRRQIVKVGESALNDLRLDKAGFTRSMKRDPLNVFVEFKRTMGSDSRYVSSNMSRSYSSEELSAEVLKALTSLVRDEMVDSCVISIPARFTQDQAAATRRAAGLAGIRHCELLPEPVAASIAYGVSSKEKNGRWLVFDFGGGTFEATLIQVEEGVIRVIDTEGDSNLGGKILDYAIVDGIILPYLKENYALGSILQDAGKLQILREAMEYYAEQAKNRQSFNPQVDIISQVDEFGEDDEGVPVELDLVITRKQVETVVRPYFQKAVDMTKRLLERNGVAGGLDKLILVGGPTCSPLLRMMLTEQVTPNIDTSIDPLTAVARGAALYAAGIDGFMVVPTASGPAVPGLRHNVAGNALLPCQIGIEVRDTQMDRDVFIPIQGLEKNRKLPAAGISNGLKISVPLRPGVKEDRLVLPVYMGEDAPGGASAIYYDHVSDIVITGDDVPAFVPSDSALDITLRMDNSQQMAVEVDFPAIGAVVKRQVEVRPRSVAEIEKELTVRHGEAISKFQSLRSASSVGPREMFRAEEMVRDIERRFGSEIHSGEGQMRLLVSLRDLFRELESVEKAHEWDLLSDGLMMEISRLESADRELGGRFTREVSEVRHRVDEVLSSHNVSIARSVREDARDLYFRATYVYQLMDIVRYHFRNFEVLKWKDTVAARSLVDEGLAQLSSGNPDEEHLRQIATGILGQLDVPPVEIPKLSR